MSAGAIEVPIDRVEGAHFSHWGDTLAVEEPLEIRLDGRSLSITMRTPGEDAELAAGYLYAEGLVGDTAQIRSIAVDESDANIVNVALVEPIPATRLIPQRNSVITSACGVCGKSSLADLQSSACPTLPADEIVVDPGLIHSLPDRLREQQRGFARTGGLHAAARFTLEGVLEAVREDVGRHNALDKLVGSALLARSLPLNRSLLLVSGRASFELVQKALMAGVPILAAVGAPSSLAVSTAERSGMTLIGFLREGRFNIYSGHQRVQGK